MLSDTLGVSMLVDAINHRIPSGATEVHGARAVLCEGGPDLPNGGDIAEGVEGHPTFSLAAYSHRKEGRSLAQRWICGLPMATAGTTCNGMRKNCGRAEK